MGKQSFDLKLLVIPAPIRNKWRLFKSISERKNHNHKYFSLSRVNKTIEIQRVRKHYVPEKGTLSYKKIFVYYFLTKYIRLRRGNGDYIKFSTKNDLCIIPFQGDDYLEQKILGKTSQKQDYNISWKRNLAF